MLECSDDDESVRATTSGALFSPGDAAALTPKVRAPMAAMTDEMRIIVGRLYGGGRECGCALNFLRARWTVSTLALPLNEIEGADLGSRRVYAMRSERTVSEVRGER